MPFDKEIIQTALRDRLLLLLSVLCIITGLIIIISTLLQVRPTDVQVPVRYSAYGVTNLYRDQWYYLLSFIGMGVLLIAQPLIALKLLQEKGREFALAYTVAAVIIGAIGALLVQAVLRVVSISI